MQSQNIQSACPYCGVGCGVKICDGKIEGDASHPANQGALCVKGTALADSLSMPSRLLYPKVSQQEVSWDTATSVISDKIQQILVESGPEAIGMYVSGQLLTEDYYVANKLMKGFIGSANIDTNSRLCMSSAVVAHIRAFGEDVVPVTYEDIDDTDLIVIVGANTAWTHPVVFRRIQQAREKNPNVKLVVIDPRKTVTAEQADLFLQIGNDGDVTLFNGLIRYMVDHGAIDHRFVKAHTNGADELLQVVQGPDFLIANIARQLGVDDQALTTFYRWFSASPTAITVFCQGINQAEDGADKGNAIINCHLLSGKIGKQGAGPFSITGQPNAMGGREVGGLANQLAVHRGFDPDTLSYVRQAWQAPNLAQKAGLKAVDLFDAVARGDIRFLWIIATNPAVSLPNSARVRAALAQCECVVVSDICANTDTAYYADILLPAAGWGEKSGMVTNSERCMTRQRAFMPPPGAAKPDWQILADVGRKLGYEEAFSFTSEADIFREYAALTAINKKTRFKLDLSALATISDDDYAKWRPTRWPLDQGVTDPQPLYHDGVFATSNAKANLVVPAQLQSYQLQPHQLQPVPSHTEQHDLPRWWLNTGRQRDQWHTMTRTGHITALAQSEAEPTVYMHPLSVQQAGLTVGQLVVLRAPSSFPLKSTLSVHRSSVEPTVLSDIAYLPDSACSPSIPPAIIVRLQSDEGLRRDQVFMSMHWAGVFGGPNTVNHVVAPTVDTLSGQPAFKSSQVTITPAPDMLHGLYLGDQEPALPDIDYCSYQKSWQSGIWRFAQSKPADCPSSFNPDSAALAMWLKTLLGNERVGNEKRADLPSAQSLLPSVAKRLVIEQSWGYVAVELNMMGEHSVVTGILALSYHPIVLDVATFGELVAKPFSLAPVLTALSHDRQSSRLICSCFRVTDQQIIDAVEKEGVVSLYQLQTQLKCGTNCGSCLPEVEKQFGLVIASVTHNL
ncbi:nitrate reductase [Photobacterium sanguinicancri]|uniref:Nitrite reductase n=1 Tax=Photobacterium sanguinicancri TaxID=875932 RepID=A0ABX4FW07_9GAMM|nr:molybdopterin-dependent oxidoreductase [Photobacterium sanguinicancri]OZS43019.1 nitrite reductase [Photobacterium sanguinicancri]